MTSTRTAATLVAWLAAGTLLSACGPADPTSALKEIRSEYTDRTVSLVAETIARNAGAIVASEPGATADAALAEAVAQATGGNGLGLAGTLSPRLDGPNALLVYTSRGSISAQAVCYADGQWLTQDADPEAVPAAACRAVVGDATEGGPADR